MSDEVKKGNLTSEELQRITAFFSLLIKIDRKNHITSIAQRKYKERVSHEA